MTVTPMQADRVVMALDAIGQHLAKIEAHLATANKIATGEIKTGNPQPKK